MATSSISRRQLLVMAGASAVAIATGCGADHTGIGRAGEGNAGQLTWRNRLRMPPLDPGEVDGDGVRCFTLRAMEGSSELRDGRPTRTWGFNGPLLGPTLRARRGERVLVEVENELPETTTVHWHGMKLPPAMDGGPHQPIAPGDTWRPAWTVDQPAATLWYHPHPHGATATHVYRGLAGLWLLDDEDDPGLPSEYGVDDVPLIVQDRDLSEDGSLREDRPVGLWGLMGSAILVNGTLDPFVEVSTRQVRFRILNGSNARVFNLGFDDGRSFHVVAGDCGLLPAPAEVDEVTISPGERVEVVVRFEPGDRVVLQSRSRGHVIDDGDFEIVQLRAGSTLRPNGAVPAALPAPEPVSLSDRPTVRDLMLAGDSRIDGQEMDMGRVDAEVVVGTTERWDVWAPAIPHNFHVHDAAFTVLEVDGRPPPPHQSGLKDTVFLPAGATARLAVGFGPLADPEAPLMFHCHILRHEDEGMMGQFTLVEPGQAPASAPRGGHASHP